MRRNCIGISIVALLLAGCAVKPESIRPAYISEMSYQSWTCDQLGQEQLRLAAALSTACDAQRQCRSNDTVGVIFLGFPVSSLSGNNQAAEISRLKGELQALQRAATLKNCDLADIPDPVKRKK